MKMPSTYISLLLLCGLMLFYLYLNSNNANINKNIKAHSDTTKTDQGSRYVKDKTNDQAFSFFENIITNISPALKRLR